MCYCHIEIRICSYDGAASGLPESSALAGNHCSGTDSIIKGRKSHLQKEGELEKERKWRPLDFLDILLFARVSVGRLWQFAHPRPLSLLQRGLAPRSKGKARAELRPARRQASGLQWGSLAVGKPEVSGHLHTVQSGCFCL